MTLLFRKAVRFIVTNIAITCIQEVGRVAGGEIGNVILKRFNQKPITMNNEAFMWILNNPSLRDRHKQYIAITKDNPEVVAESDDLGELLETVKDRVHELYFHQFA